MFKKSSIPGKVLTFVVLLLLPLTLALSTSEAATGYKQTNLVSDGFIPAPNIDPNLINPWV